ncbi:hypothetical protein BDY17DRAFT_291783 [Neohortaea acidophila]|uniref:Uncharacterized protein n=1 Tax=Neohortaea acidophila TaxID=245834 RepID=A0A6A6Q3M2_9PEZI|nr:uncharacterized protein BDY17DRAFT_291783 [Neohortaea acidophila]KAF2486614.1 hypothetical protein BDY17DRAFT_291783 [Neohortaea acidophila]
MSRTGEERGEDLFLELANDRAAVEHARPISHGEPLQRRISSAANPPSLSSERRPRSSGNALGQGGASMLDKSAHLQRHVARHSTPFASPSPWIDEDGASISSKSRSGVPRRPEMSSERLPSRLNNHARPADLPQFGRGRPSFGSSPQTLLAQPSQLSHNWPDSFQYPTGNSEPKPSNPDSASVASETAETVWDELDDLKSRIKKLELTGKLPSTSGAAALPVEHNDRPRTATTAPTTIDSSPKHDKSEPQQQMPESRSRSIAQEMSGEYAVGGPGAANIHPNLHAALAKAKPLLSPTLFRTLEATAADALQLAAMTGSAGPQGTAMTAASIINGVTVSDRHVRRKADTMCRNLTDLVLALCEGRSEAPSLVSSPTPSTKQSPSLRYSRSSLGPTDGISRAAARPMSRLEARRSSILGSQGGNSSSLAGSPLEATGDASLSEHESTASYPRLQRPDPTPSGRAASRLQAARERHFGSGAAGDDEDPTIRPPSRAATDAGRSARSFLRRDFNTPSRSPSFRDSLAARRTSQDYFSRVPSDSSADLARRHALDTFNTLVVPEESDAGDRRSISRATSRTNRRVTSYVPHSSRRSGGAISGEGPSLHRATSLQQRRHVLVE